jgi:SAM-dependent methyltransferase
MSAMMAIRNRIPPRARREILSVLSRPRVRRLLHRPRWGNLRRHRPFSDRYGFDRGTPIDRYYIDRFIAAHHTHIRGRVLEVADGRYTDQHRAAVTRLDILDIDPRNDLATIIADLDDADSLPADTFDCIVFTQTLHYVSNMDTAMTNVWNSLAPGGVVLVTASAASKIDHNLSDHDAWRLLPIGLSHLMERTCSGADVTVSAKGNLVAILGFLLGVAAEELSAADLATDDPHYPLISCGIARKPSREP